MHPADRAGRFFRNGEPPDFAKVDNRNCRSVSDRMKKGAEIIGAGWIK